MTGDTRTHAHARYKALLEDEDEARLQRTMDALSARDEVQQRAAAVTKLPVTAWHCRECRTTTERRRPGCQARGRPAPCPHSPIRRSTPTL